MTIAAAPRRGMPIALQLISLLTAGWAVTLLITAAIVLLLPPPSRQYYRVAEVADALRGGSLSVHDGRPLVRLRGPEPPRNGRARVSSGVYRMVLARALDVPPSQVRLERYPIADPVQRALVRALLSSPPAGSAPPGSFPGLYGGPVAMAPSQAPVAAQDGAQGSAQRDNEVDALARSMPQMPRSLPPISGDFSAGLKTASGDWITVRPSPEPFPNQWQQRILLWLLACFGILAPIGYLFARRLSAPIAGFAEAAERLGRDPNAPPIAVSGPVEIGQAATAFNEMQARLSRYVEHRTATIGAVAHDLRTPLARIRFKIESLPAGVRDSISRDVTQMEQMIAAALAFVREASAVRPRALVDLSSAIECVVDSAALLGAAATVEASEPLVVQADGLGLERLFGNLLDNAVKYAGGAQVRLYRDGRMAIIEVSDHGPGVPASELERVFEPFYRSDPARTANASGMGLGLAVARSIARAHGGDIELINTGEGLIARVRLPLAPEASRPGPAEATTELVPEPAE